MTCVTGTSRLGLLAHLSSSSAITYRWFSADVTVAMLVDENKTVSLHWELNSDSCKFCEEKFYCFVQQHDHLVTWLKISNNIVTLFIIVRNEGISGREIKSFIKWV